MTREQINDFKNPRTVIGLAGCAFGLGLVVFGLAAGSSSKATSFKPCRKGRSRDCRWTAPPRSDS